MTLTLDKCEGPACPRCGCQDTEVRNSAGRRWGIPTFWRRCRNCGFSWTESAGWEQRGQPAPEVSPAPPTFPEPASAPVDHAPGVVTYPRLRCPQCGSVKVRCTSSPKAPAGEARVRKHRCECGHAFQSIEEAG